MCGIIGITSTKPVSSSIINSLKTSVILEALSSTANTGPKLGLIAHLIVT